MARGRKHYAPKKMKGANVALRIIFMFVALFLAVVISDKGLLTKEPVEETATTPTAQYSISTRLASLSQVYSQKLISENCQGVYSDIDPIVPDFVLSSSDLVVYDETHKKVLFEKNADQKAYPASTTKLLTASVAAQYCDSSTVFTVGDELSFVAWDSSLADLKQGQKLTFDELLDALLLPSGNDAAYVMAAGVGRIYTGNKDLPAQDAINVFCTLMNNTAKRIGALNSNFTCPDGYNEGDHYTTAMDMMKIALYASSFSIIKTAYGKSQAEHTLLTGEKYTWYNSNPLIDPESSYFYKYATGMKTGYTDLAGSCLVASAEKDGINIIAVALKGPSISSRNKDLINLFDKAFECAEKEN